MAVDYALEGVKWGSDVQGTSGGTVTWALDGTVPANFVTAISSAFAAWSAVAKISFTQIASAASANITFSDGPIDGRDNILGVTNYSFTGNGALRHADIEFDSAEGWSGSGTAIASLSGFKLFLVALHEIGHAIGLDHYGAATAVMNAYISPNLTGLTQSDIDGVQALYGAVTAPVVAAAPVVVTSTTTSAHTFSVVYRFNDATKGQHFYTTDPNEKAAILATLPNMTYEGTQWATPSKASDTVDVFRFVDTKTGSHFYTSSTVERDTTIATLKNYTYEGVAFEAYAQPGAAGSFQLERFFNKVSGEHHYSASAAETAGIKAGLAGAGWVDEGASFSVQGVTADMLHV